MLIWFILVDRSWQPFENICLLNITSLAENGDIHDIQKKVQEARSDALSRVDTTCLLVWRCTKPIQPKNFDDIDDETLHLQVMQVFSEKKVKELSSSVRIAHRISLWIGAHGNRGYLNIPAISPPALTIYPCSYHSICTRYIDIVTRKRLS